MDKNKIKVSDIASAEKILGIEYSKEEREQMITDLENQIISNKMRRKNKFDNNVPMASKFDPRLPNFKMPPSSGLKIRIKKSKTLEFLSDFQKVHLATGFVELVTLNKKGKPTRIPPLSSF